MAHKFPPQAAPSWNLTAEQITAENEACMKALKQTYDEVAAETAPTFDNVIKKMALENGVQGRKTNLVTFFQHVSTDKALRDASSAAGEALREFEIEESMREDVFKTVEAVQKQAPAVDAESAKLLDKTYKSFVRNGLGLSAAKREELKAVQKQISGLEVTYSKNSGEETGFVLFTREELAGVPEDVIEQFAEVDGKLKMTFKYPDVFPVLKYAQSGETRRRAFVGDQNKVMDNCELLTKAVELRYQAAAMLDYKSHADFVLEERMAKDSASVLAFLNDLRAKLTGQGKVELAKLAELKAADLAARGEPAEDTFYIWDYRFYDRLLLEKEYDVDAQKIAEYFPMQSTVDKMLNIFEVLFKLKFVEVTGDDRSVWHEDCKQFAVWKDVPGADEFVGWLYFDMHPREGKYGHAANFNLGPGYTDADGKRVYPVTALVCNFSRPTAKKPSLLKHDEVVTFFHELGHGIHDLVSETQYAMFHGTNVARDFVEAPSQMLEYWCWEPEQLKFLSSHYLEPAKSIDDELIKSIVRSKHVNGGLFNLRQLHFALFDMALHTSDGKIDVTKAWNDMRQEISLLSQGNETTYGYSSFGHLMGGYDSGYYGYLWSQVFAADIYYSTFAADPMDPAAGGRYRDTILKPGGSLDEYDNLEKLLGRKPNNVAFLKELGVTDA
ncbi:uncharacterized protein V1510DRAFT_423861 [Dipodascopsis tothii]|uniref:uncharacterized protein n=1 Tax=Dipodascopsis tothii TaxID=44089 RepID=UPI0034CE5BFC